jgi:general secretion pathway protein K
MTTRRPPPRPRQRGAALLLAMIVVTLVSTIASSMVWQQWRATQVEAAERGRIQASWMLRGALDWARIVLREDKPEVDSLDDVWARPLEEARLSTFLALDKDRNTDTGPEAFLSGRMEDAQARYNLRNLIKLEPAAAAAELAVLRALCAATGVASNVPELLQKGLIAASSQGNTAQAPMYPRTVAQLTWLGLAPADLAKLAPYVVLLPRDTPVNVNTAPREVLMAVIDGLDSATADRLIRARQSKPFDGSNNLVQKMLPNGANLPPDRLSFKTSFFEIWGRMRLDQRVLEERSLVERRGRDEIVPITLERLSSHLGGG